jgi:hypothetical protein
MIHVYVRNSDMISDDARPRLQEPSCIPLIGRQPTDMWMKARVTAWQIILQES